MPTYELRSYSEEVMLHNINVAKRILLATLAARGVLRQEYAERFDREWFFVMQKPSWISTVWRKMLGRADEETLILVRTLNIKPDKPEATPEAGKESVSETA